MGQGPSGLHEKTQLKLDKGQRLDRGSTAAGKGPKGKNKGKGVSTGVRPVVPSPLNSGPHLSPTHLPQGNRFGPSHSPPRSISAAHAVVPADTMEIEKSRSLPASSLAVVTAMEVSTSSASLTSNSHD